MRRKELPSEEETARFGRTWERYLRRTTVRAMQEGGGPSATPAIAPPSAKRTDEADETCGR